MWFRKKATEKRRLLIELKTLNETERQVLSYLSVGGGTPTDLAVRMHVQRKDVLPALRRMADKGIIRVEHRPTGVVDKDIYQVPPTVVSVGKDLAIIQPIPV